MLSDATIRALTSEADRIWDEMQSAASDELYYWAKEELRDLTDDVRGMGLALERDGHRFSVIKL